MSKNLNIRKKHAHSGIRVANIYKLNNVLENRSCSYWTGALYELYGNVVMLPHNHITVSFEGQLKGKVIILINADLYVSCFSLFNDLWRLNIKAYPLLS